MYPVLYWVVKPVWLVAPEKLVGWSPLRLDAPKVAMLGGFLIQNRTCALRACTVLENEIVGDFLGQNRICADDAWTTLEVVIVGGFRPQKRICALAAVIETDAPVEIVGDAILQNRI